MWFCIQLMHTRNVRISRFHPVWASIVVRLDAWSCDDARVTVSPPILETERLRLRPLVPTDAKALHRIQSDPDHMRFYPHPFSVDETQEWIARVQERYERDGFGLLAVDDRTTGAFLGNVGPMVQVVDGVDEVEIGWSITPARSRQGIATEAAIACRDWVFDVVGTDHVISLILPANEPSRGVARKLGMTVWKQTIFGSVRWLHDVWRINSAIERGGRERLRSTAGLPPRTDVS
jgi:[ribosomal protein S5]-alanine N-acetyltransferase